MKNQRTKALGTTRTGLIIIFSLLFTSMLDVDAQEAVIASGGDASGSGGSISYSVGQVVYTTATGTNGSVAQGVQQPYEISVPTAMKNTEDVILIMAYPNPVKDILRLKIGQRDPENISYRLFDINGKLITGNKMSGPEVPINMQALSPSVYFLKIIEGNKEIKTFKIIKK